MSWYYRQQGRTQGPVSESELDALVQNGTLSPGTFIWQKGLPQWQRYQELRGQAAAATASGEAEAPAAQKGAEVAAAGGDGWYYVHNDQACGPVSAAELDALVQNGSLPPDTYVFCQGMTDWQAYATVKGLAQAQPAQPAQVQHAQKSGAARVSIAKTARPAAAAQAEGACSKCGTVLPVTHLLRLGQDYICMSCHSSAERGARAAKRRSASQDSSWGSALVFAGLILACFAGLFIFGLQNPKVATAYVTVNGVFALIVQICILVAAFSESVGQGFLTLCVPCYVVYFVFGRCESSLLKVLFLVAIVTSIAGSVLMMQQTGSLK